MGYSVPPADLPAKEHHSQGQFYNSRHEYIPAEKTCIAPFDAFACYYDMDGLKAAIKSWKQDSPTENYDEFNVQRFTTYLSSLYTQLLASGINQINLSFTQLCDLDAFAAGDFSNLSANDNIGLLMNQLIADDVLFAPEENLLKLITQEAQNRGMRIGLSYGGEKATATDFQVCKEDETPKDQARKLYQFMQDYSISCVDFNIQGADANAFASDPHTQLFLSTLHKLLTNGTKTTTLTIQGNLTEAVQGSSTDKEAPSTFNGPLKPFFYDANNTPIFASLFDGLNLMLYDNAQHYLDDTETPNWCIEDWLGIVALSQTALTHIGFQDAIPYKSTEPAFSDCTDCEPNDSSGMAGAKIFLEIQRILEESDHASSLGQPFFWPNYNPERYKPTNHDLSQFVSEEMQDFCTMLHTPLPFMQ